MSVGDLFPPGSTMRQSASFTPFVEGPVLTEIRVQLPIIIASLSVPPSIRECVRPERKVQVH